jgi:tetratricopeptide (TPR) repeat protein
MAFDFVDEDALSNQAGEWASYLAKKLSNKDDIQLIQEPIEVLTPLFLQGLCKLAEQAPIALFFDTYEQTDEFLDSWLRDVLDGKYGDVPPNIVITIAGRHALVDNHWATYDGVIARFPLEPFTEDEAKQYLHRKGITNPKVVDVILQLSGRLPLLIATLAAGSPDHPEQVGEPSDTAVERFLKWVEDPKQRQIALSAALPRKFNRDIIAQLASEDDAEALFSWLKKMPFVKEQRDGWVYHQVVRTQMLRYQRLTSPNGWEAAQEKLKNYFDERCKTLAVEDDKQQRDPDWQHYTLEALYHNLCATPQQQLNPAVNGFLAALKNQRSFASQWAEVMKQAGQDVESNRLNDWGQQFVEGLRAYDNDEYPVTVAMFSKLLNDSILESRWCCVALAWRGNTYRLMDSYEDALRDLNKALEVESDDEWAIARRGVTYRLMERYEEALADLSHAIDLKPDDAWNFANRGVTYCQMERYEEALADLTHALELKASHWTLYERGNAYRKLDQPSLAQADFQKAIQLVEHNLQTNPDDIQDRFNLALYYLANSQFELSKQTYQKGLTRGATPSQIREAVQDLKEFLKLFPAHPQAMTFYNGLRKKLESLLVKLDLKKH